MHKKKYYEEKRYRPRGEFRQLTKADKTEIFDTALPDEFIIIQVDNLAAFLPDFGVESAKELMVMLCAWMAKPENQVEANIYRERLRKEIV